MTIRASHFQDSRDRWDNRTPPLVTPPTPSPPPRSPTPTSEEESLSSYEGKVGDYIPLYAQEEYQLLVPRSLKPLKSPSFPNTPRGRIRGSTSTISDSDPFGRTRSSQSDFDLMHDTFRLDMDDDETPRARPGGQRTMSPIRGRVVKPPAVLEDLDRFIREMPPLEEIMAELDRNLASQEMVDVLLQAENALNRNEAEEAEEKTNRAIKIAVELNDQSYIDRCEVFLDWAQEIRDGTLGVKKIKRRARERRMEGRSAPRRERSQVQSRKGSDVDETFQDDNSSRNSSPGADSVQVLQDILEEGNFYDGEDEDGWGSAASADEDCALRITFTSDVTDDEALSVLESFSDEHEDGGHDSDFDPRMRPTTPNPARTPSPYKHELEPDRPVSRRESHTESRNGSRTESRAESPAESRTGSPSQEQSQKQRQSPVEGPIQDQTPSQAPSPSPNHLKTQSPSKLQAVGPISRPSIDLEHPWNSMPDSESESELDSHSDSNTVFSSALYSTSASDFASESDTDPSDAECSSDEDTEHPLPDLDQKQYRKRPLSPTSTRTFAYSHILRQKRLPKPRKRCRADDETKSSSTPDDTPETNPSPNTNTALAIKKSTTSTRTPKPTTKIATTLQSIPKPWHTPTAHTELTSPFNNIFINAHLPQILLTHPAPSPDSTWATKYATSPFPFNTRKFTFRSKLPMSAMAPRFRTTTLIPEQACEIIPDKSQWESFKREMERENKTLPWEFLAWEAERVKGLLGEKNKDVFLGVHCAREKKAKKWGDVWMGVMMQRRKKEAYKWAPVHEGAYRGFLMKVVGMGVLLVGVFFWLLMVFFD
ncbi:hypothetical protein BJY04DRAFT_215735 [Aspergillus karnatakaensis]|uniref:uncharacterized protein n=1 Tax=Aspergillus karnatakaensis TaxID=1810916 RepID=UPI003CCDD7EA